MYFKGDKLYWFLRKDVFGRRLLKVNSSKLRRSLLKRFSNHLLYGFKIPTEIFYNRPDDMSVSALWRFRRIFSQFLFARFFYRKSTLKWHLLDYATSYFTLKAILHNCRSRSLLFSPSLSFNFFFSSLPSLKKVKKTSLTAFTSLLPHSTSNPFFKNDVFVMHSVQQPFMIKENIAREQLRSRLYWIRKAHNKHNAATYRPKRFYLFLGEKPRKHFRQLYIQPHSPRNKAALKLELFKRLYRTRKMYRLGNFFYLFKFLTFNFLASSFFFLPKNRIQYFNKFFILNNQESLKPFLSPGDLFSIKFNFWPVMRYFFMKKLLLARWSRQYRRLYNYFVKKRIRRKKKEWDRITRFFQKFSLTWDPYAVISTSHVEFSFLIFSGIILKLPSKYLYTFRWE